MRNLNYTSRELRKMDTETLTELIDSSELHGNTEADAYDVLSLRATQEALESALRNGAPHRAPRVTPHPVETGTNWAIVALMAGGHR